MKLNYRDWMKGYMMAFATPVLLYLINALEVPGFTFADLNLGMLVKMGLAAGLTYMIKNFFTAENGKVLGRY